MLPPLHHYAPPPDNGLEILYEDEALLVVNKPYGLLSVPGRGEEKQDSLITRLQRQFADALIVHRLDMETSGLIVLARSAEAHRVMSQRFAQREVKKRYVAQVHGRMQQRYGEVELPLMTDWPNRPRQMVDMVRGKAALTYYEVVDVDHARQQTRVALYPHTGRSHQLRVHMLALGHPIIGDRLYVAKDDVSVTRMYLHAEYLAFAHPLTQQLLCLESEPAF